MVTLIFSNFYSCDIHIVIYYSWMIIPITIDYWMQSIFSNLLSMHFSKRRSKSLKMKKLSNFLEIWIFIAYPESLKRKIVVLRGFLRIFLIYLLTCGNQFTRIAMVYNATLFRVFGEESNVTRLDYWKFFLIYFLNTADLLLSVLAHNDFTKP